MAVWLPGAVGRERSIPLSSRVLVTVGAGVTGTGVAGTGVTRGARVRVVPGSAAGKGGAAGMRGFNGGGLDRGL